MWLCWTPSSAQFQNSLIWMILVCRLWSGSMPISVNGDSFVRTRTECCMQMSSNKHVITDGDGLLFLPARRSSYTSSLLVPPNSIYPLRTFSSLSHRVALRYCSEMVITIVINNAWCWAEVCADRWRFAPSFSSLRIILFLYFWCALYWTERSLFQDSR
jgi:hypothetical protein